VASTITGRPGEGLGETVTSFRNVEDGSAGTAGVTGVVGLTGGGDEVEGAIAVGVIGGNDKSAGFGRPQATAASRPARTGRMIIRANMLSTPEGQALASSG
jgi:hypothetical protein